MNDRRNMVIFNCLFVIINLAGFAAWGGVFSVFFALVHLVFMALAYKNQ